MPSYDIQVSTIVDSYGQPCLHFVFNGQTLTNDEIKHIIRQTLIKLRVKLTANRKVVDMEHLDACVDPSTRMVAVMCPLVPLELKPVYVEGAQIVGPDGSGSPEEAELATQNLIRDVEATVISIIV